MTNHEQYEYTVVEKNPEDPKLNIIEKKGISAKFTMAEIEAAENVNRKNLRELDGMIEIRKATMQNIADNHPFVLEMTEQDRFTVHMYQESFAFARACEIKKKQLQEALDQSELEKQEITKQCGVVINLKDLETNDESNTEGKV